MIKNSRGKYPAAVYCLAFNKYGSGRDRVRSIIHFSFFIFHSSFRREAPYFARRLCAAKPHIFRAISTENNKTAGFVSRRPTAG